MRPPPHADEHDNYPPIPDGLIPGQEFVSTRKGTVRQWIRMYGETSLETLDEAIVWIVAHEAYHFLRKTHQIPGKNAEIEADRFSDEALEHFRSGWSPGRFHALVELRARKASAGAARPD